MKVNWQALFQENGIHYRMDGPNCASGNIVIKCPFCGSSDPSEHMGINLETGAWGCWRNSLHRGGNPAYLIDSIFHCSFEEARNLLAVYGEGALPSKATKDGFINFINSKLNLIESAVPKPIEIQNKLKIPREWMKIQMDNPLIKYAVNYLKSRGFSDSTIYYSGLYGAISGDMSYRVIFPVIENGELVAWTGRSVLSNLGLRYKSSLKGSGGDNIKDHLLGYDECKVGYKPIIGVEGPMDWLKIKQLGYGKVNSLAFFNKTLSDRQLMLINRLSANNRLFLVCMDPDAPLATMSITRQLSLYIKTKAIYLPGPEDPGELNELGFSQAFNEFIS